MSDRNHQPLLHKAQLLNTQVNIDLCMVMCVDAEYGYSKNNNIPWNIESEYEHFQKILSSYAKGNASIIIGRKT